MKLSTVFTVAAVLMIVLGLVTLLAPGAMAGVGPAPSPSMMTERFVGVEMLGLGLIAWFVRNSDASKARDGAALGFTIYFALHALTSLYGQFTDTSTSAHWVAFLIQAAFAVAFFIAGKAGMSQSTS